MIVWRIAIGVADWNARPTMSGKSPPLAGHSGVCYLLLLGPLLPPSALLARSRIVLRRALALTEDNYIAHDSLGALLQPPG